MSVRRKSASAPRARTPAASPCAVALPADCTLHQVAALHGQLAKALKRSAAITLDARSVQRIDAASLQLLVAFLHQRRAQGRAVAWSEPHPVIGQAARRLGLEALLEIPPQGAVRA